jgi:ABC-type transporter Mla maintaining outer membrane lipid asymmetry permease subunit MlaE
VGDAAMKAVVTAALLILVADYFLAAVIFQVLFS